MKNKNKLLIIIIWIFIIPFALLWFYLQWWVSDDWDTATDSLSLTWVKFVAYTVTSDEYFQEIDWSKKRGYLYNEWNNLILKSHLYWDFIYNDSKIDLLYKSASDSHCDWWTSRQFYSSWSFVHVDPDKWWSDIKVVWWTDNFYCPNTQKFSIPLSSINDDWTPNDSIWIFTYKDTNSFISFEVKDAYWKEKIISLWDVLNNKWIYINWSFLWGKNLNVDSFKWTITWSGIDNIWNIVIWDWWVNSMSELNLNLDKNIFKLTRWLSSESWNITNFSINNINKKLYYYNYSWQEAADINWNKWKIVTFNNSTNDYIKINWNNTVIVEWGNIYIKDDLINVDDNTSLLTIIVKRDKKNNKNWWNIYIDPSVTNIDAILIADWSILNYWGWLNILDSTNDALRKQLLIYWSISTKNTIWINKLPYWSDDYIINESKTFSWTWNIYDLTNLRSFRPILSDQIITSDYCYTSDINVTAVHPDWNKSLTWSLAWKKKCFITDSTKNYRRSTDKLTPVVIIYNPIIQKIPPEVFLIK